MKLEPIERYDLCVKKILLVGTITNVARTLEKELEIVRNSLIGFAEVDIFLVESDSTDHTIALLELIQQKIENFKFASLGNLKVNIPYRIDRIRYCRNYYVQYIRSNYLTSRWDYVLVADLDGMCKDLNANAVISCFESMEWDALFANQPGGYYDITALRHQYWCPDDCMQELIWRKSLIPKRNFSRFNFVRNAKIVLDYDKARNLAVYKKMLVLDPTADWIPVESAFGGLGLYRTNCFMIHDYGEQGSTSENEHVTFHRALRKQNFRLYINPRLVNNHWNTYNLNRFFLIRQFRRVVWNQIGIMRSFKSNLNL